MSISEWSSTVCSSDFLSTFLLAFHFSLFRPELLEDDGVPKMTYPAISTPLLQSGMAQLRSIRTRGGTVRSIIRCRANFSRSPEGEVALSPRRFDTPPISPVCYQQAPDKGGCLLG